MTETALQDSWSPSQADSLPESVTKLGRKLTVKGNVSGYGAHSAKRVYVGEGTRIGWPRIAQYLGVSVDTVIRWEKRQRFPVCRLPDGRVMTTLSLIDQWVMARIEAQRGERSA